MRFEIIEQVEYTKSLNDLSLSPEEIEEMKEALDWKLSRDPESGQKVHTETITIFYESYRLRFDEYLIIAYTIEGNTVFLQDVRKDLSQEF